MVFVLDRWKRLLKASSEGFLLRDPCSDTVLSPPSKWTAVELDWTSLWWTVVLQRIRRYLATHGNPSENEHNNARGGSRNEVHGTDTPIVDANGRPALWLLAEACFR